MAKNKVCRICGVPIEQSASYGGGRICDFCHKIYRKQKDKESRQRNRKRRLQREARERAKPERQAYLKEYMGPYSKRRYQDNKEYHSEQKRKWEKANPEKVRTNRRKNEHRRRAAQGTYTEEQLQARIDFYGRRCYLPWCGHCNWDALLSPQKQIDHVIPISRGGTNWPANLRPACGSCNLKKGNRQTANDFVGSL